MNREIKNIKDWKTLSHLEQLYSNGETKGKKDNLYFKYLQEYNRIDLFTYKSKIIATNKFKDFYEKKIEEIFQKHNEFLINNNVKELSSNFLISDIESLITIENNKTLIIEEQRTRRQISSRYFKNGDAKYLKNNLEKAVKEILSIKEFPEDNKEQQFISILHSKETPKKIILCENEDRLINPRQNDIEIWHAGGKNIAKLKYIPKPDIEIHYLCDWDYDGLKTYLTIKQKYFKQIELIIPQNYTKKGIEETDHKSKWKPDFDINKFNETEKKILSDIIPNYWIEEESIDIEFVDKKKET